MNRTVIQRRLVSVSRVLGMWAAMTILFPVLALVAAGVDAALWLVGRRRWMTLRLLMFGWVFFAVEVWGLVRLAATWLPAGRRAHAAYRVQWWFARTLLDAVLRIFSMRLVVHGEDQIRPGPVVVFVRHASIVDNLLPPAILSDRNGLEMRWILKQELLGDPALDIAGNRLHNYFVDRSGDDSATQIQAIRELGDTLGPNEGVVIYPEGTRFSPGKRTRILDRLRTRDPAAYERASGLHHVLPPRLGGPLALLEHGTDVLFMAHHGLGGFSHLSDIWKGGMVDSTITVDFWRVPSADVPRSESDQAAWLHDQWVRLDAWVAEQAVAAG